MKKLILLIVPVLFVLASCNNNPPSPAPTPTSKDTSTTTTTTVVTDTTKKTSDNGVTGTGGTPAQVFVDATNTAIPGVLVTANDGKSNVGTGTSNTNGMYNITGLVVGTTYTYTPSKSGYTGKAQSGKYDGTTNSLPPIPMTKNQ